MQKKIVQLVLFCPFLLYGEIIPLERRMEWHPGLPGEFPIPTSTVNIRDYGAKGDGISDDFNAFMMAIQDFFSDNAVLFIPRGTYLIRGTLFIDKRIVLQGEGPDKTVLLFDLQGQHQNCIEISKYDRGDWIPISSGIEKGSRWLVAESPWAFRPGDFVEIQQKNDSSLFYFPRYWNEYWSQNAVGLIRQVESIRGDTIFLTEALPIEFRSELYPVIRRQGFVTYAGIQHLGMKRLDQGSGHTILIKNSAFCLIQDIESQMAGSSHVFLETAYRCEIRDSYFHHAHQYHNGDLGHGVVCSFHATNNLIENNIFKSLSHAMMLHLGASGNVFGYNFSTEPLVLDTVTFADVAFHGFYPFCNLFESNVVEEIAISETGGPSGPGNTFFRNRVGSSGIFISRGSHGQNLVANVVSNNAPIVIDSAAYDTFVHANRIQGRVQWDSSISDRTLPASYYLSKPPAFWEDSPWPLFGPDVEGEYLLPAERRYRQITGFSFPSSRTRACANGLKLELYPNPFNAETVIQYTVPFSGKVMLNLIDIKGRRVMQIVEGNKIQGIYVERVDARFLSSGLYFLVLQMDGFVAKKKALVIK